MKINNYKKESWKKYSGYAAGFVGLLSILLLFTACPGTNPGKETYYDVPGSTVTVEGIPFVMKHIATVKDGSIGWSTMQDNPVRKVSLTAYQIGETEVTQELWQSVMGYNPSVFKGANNPPAAGEVQSKRPVEMITWFECIAFCNELTKKANGGASDSCVYYTDAAFTTVYTKADASIQTLPYADWSKKGFRLPTEAEWEWAAKGGTDDKWARVNMSDNLKDYAWVSDTGAGGKTHEVKKKKPNRYGLYDMTGNVLEWCWDWYWSDTSINNDHDPTGKADGTERVIRGGSWYQNANNATRMIRFADPPNTDDKNRGFRIACRS